MADFLFEAPLNLIVATQGSFISSDLLESYAKKNGKAACDKIVGLLKYSTKRYRVDATSWWNELFYVRILTYQKPWLTSAVLETFAQIILQSLAIPRDCDRKLLPGQSHDLRFFTNHRVIQVYCCHNSTEEGAFSELASKDLEFHSSQKDNKFEGQTYDQFTRLAFWRSSQYLAWECIFPEGLDMEALSPRDVNAHIKTKQPFFKAKAPSKLSQKEKDHPPPPPAEVREPPCSDRKHGAIYKTGKCLGKGGFAICYEGQLAGTKQIYALKIVKSHMPQKKMEQKV